MIATVGEGKKISRFITYEHCERKLNLELKESESSRKAEQIESLLDEPGIEESFIAVTNQEEFAMTNCGMAYTDHLRVLTSLIRLASWLEPRRSI